MADESRHKIFALPLMFAASLRLLFLTGLKRAWFVFWPLLAIGLLAPQARAQYQFDRWTTDNGLPDNSISSVLQTRDGYLWLTTFDGLVRFDGVRFTIFNAANTPALKSNQFINLLEDRAGNLWASTENSGLVRYHAGVFTSFPPPTALRHNWWQRLLEAEDGSILFYTEVGPFRLKDGAYLPLKPSVGAAWQSIALRGATGAIWHADQTGLHHSLNGRVVRSVAADWLRETIIHSFHEDQRGELWVWTNSRHLRHYKNEQWRAYTISGQASDVSARVIYSDSQGEVWVGMTNGRLLRFRDGQFIEQSLPSALAERAITSACEDREGSLWFSTFNGLYRLRPQMLTTYTETDGLTTNNIYPIYQDRRGHIWLGGWHGLTEYADGRFTRYSLEDYKLVQKESDARGLVTALAEDHAGGFWAATFGGGIWHVKDGQVNFYKQKDYGLTRTGIHTILADRVGNVWLGTRTNLLRYRDGTFTVYTTRDGLAGDDVRALLEDRQGNLWFGTGAGLTRYSNGVFRAFTAQDGLSGRQVRALYEDRAGVLWIGTHDGGLNRLADGRFTSFTTRQGLFSNAVFQILEDDRDNLWMSCNLGIYRVSKQQLNDYAAGKLHAITSVAYGKADGMRDTICNNGSQPAGIRARDGKLWFPTQGGAVVIDPATVRVNTQPPPVIIEECLLEREPIAFNGEVTIPPGKDNFELRYTGLSLIKSEQIKFRYQLEGLDRAWIEAGTRRTAYYNHVPPGNYVFKVIAANSDGVWNLAGASLRIIVVPPFWRRWWFSALAAACLVGVLMLAYRRRVAQLERAQRAQEEFSRQLIASQEQERKRIAAELHDSLGQRLIIVKNLLLLRMNLPKETAPQDEQLSEISTEVSQAIAEVKEISYNLRPHQLDQLGLSKALAALLKRVGNSSGITFTTELAQLDGRLTPEAEIGLYRIVQEGVNNIVKHSGATAARVSIACDAAGVELTIQDNGRGFTVNGDASGRGFGLIGIVERARLLGGHAQIESAPGAGTTITITGLTQNGIGHQTKRS